MTDGCECYSAGHVCCDLDDYDPTDAELEAAWNGPDAHEAHRAAWVLHQETHA